MALVHSPSVVTNGLVLSLDPANSKSYSGSGSTWVNLIGQAGCTNASPNYSTSNSGVFSYDGVDDHTVLPASLIPTGAQITFSIWQNINNVGQRSSFYMNGAAPNYYRVMQAHITWSDNQVYWDAGAGTGGYDRINGFTTLEQRTGWHNWVFTKNATTGIMKIYVDGSVFTSGTGKTANIGTTSFAYLGGAWWDGFWFSGNISNFSIYNRELSTEEIVQNFNALRGRFGL